MITIAINIINMNVQKLLRTSLAACVLGAGLLGTAARADDDDLRARFETINGVPVLWLDGGIADGSSQVAELALRQTQRYREVWLNSPGGDVGEGFAIGMALRRYKATVRVPALKGVYCASSCTNMMLGGYNRIVEPDAKFLVHAASGVMKLSGLTKKVQLPVSGGGYRSFTAEEIIQASLQDPQNLRAVVEAKQISQVGLSVRMLKYFQTVLGGTPNDALYATLQQHELTPVYGQGGRDLMADVARLRHEGVVGLQEILTQTELGGMRQMLGYAQEIQPDLGRGAKVAARIFAATLGCRIQDVCLLGQTQLRSLGYHNFDPAPLQ